MVDLSALNNALAGYLREVSAAWQRANPCPDDEVELLAWTRGLAAAKRLAIEAFTQSRRIGEGSESW